MAFTLRCQIYYYVMNDFSPWLRKSVSPKMLCQCLFVLCTAPPDMTGSVPWHGSQPQTAVPVGTGFMDISPLLNLDTSLFQQYCPIPFWVRTQSAVMTLRRCLLLLHADEALKECSFDAEFWFYILIQRWPVIIGFLGIKGKLEVV